MGILKTIGKVVISPIYVPYKMKKKAKEKQFRDKKKVVAIIDTTFPNNYQDYFESLGHHTDIVRGRVVVWAKDLTREEIERIKTASQEGKLKEMGI